MTKRKPYIHEFPAPGPVIIALKVHNARMRDIVKLAVCAMTYIKLVNSRPFVNGQEGAVKAASAEFVRMQQLVAKIENSR